MLTLLDCLDSLKSGRNFADVKRKQPIITLKTSNNTTQTDNNRRYKQTNKVQLIGANI